MYHAEITGFVVESTYNWYWLVDGLMEAGYRVHLANPAAMQQYSGLKYTDDRSDARWVGDIVHSCSPFCLSHTVRRQLWPLSAQISKTFMAFVLLLCVVVTPDRGTEKPGGNALHTDSATTSGRSMRSV